MWIVMAALAAPMEHRVEAAGEHSVVVDLPSFGRYAFEVRSQVGTSLALVDRMEGPGPRDGIVGGQDGRIDTFFDKGQVKVVARAPHDGRGEAVVTVTPFERVGTASQLLRNRPELTELEDKQERAWWVDATSGKTAFEVVGRHLGDVRIWKDGTWLVAARPRCESVSPVDGQPLQRCVLTPDLEGGLYQLVAYGAPGEAWAAEAPDAMLSVRWDAPILPGSGSHVGRIGPTGLDFFTIDGAPDTVRLALPDIAPASVEMRPWSDASVFDPIRSGASITDASRTPEATTRHHGPGGNGKKVVAVRGAPGQRYDLTWFDAAPQSTAVRSGGDVLVTSLSLARPSDDLPITGVFHRRVPGTTEVVQLATAAVKLDGTGRFEHRFNLLQPAQLLIELPESTDVLAEMAEGEADLRLERFFVDPPREHRVPSNRRNRWAERHDAGLYVLTLTPVQPGIVTLKLSRNAWSDVASSAVGGETEVLPLRPGVATILDLEGSGATFTRFGPGGIDSGLEIRDLPLDPRRGVAIPLAPGEVFSVPVRSPEAVTLHARLPNGERLPLYGLGAPVTEMRLAAETALGVGVHNATDAPVVAVLGIVERPPEPIPLPPSRLEALPDFPTLSFDAPYHTDLERSQSRTLELTVARDGLYQLESTGLLATRGTLRSRVALDLGSGSQNGVGRNFRVARYLRSGTYQTTVGALGQTTGHLGVVLREAPVRDGGLLDDGELARATLEPGEGIAYRFEVTEPGRYRVESTGQQQTFTCRIEDADRWPVTAPDARCDATLDLSPGTYTVLSLPSAVQTRRRTRVTRDRGEPVREGHGPFELTLGEAAYHTWTEPTGNGDRPTDVWTFELPADATVFVEPGDEMAGAIFAEDDATPVARLSPSRVWRDRLERGRYRVELRAARRGTGVPYSVRVGTDEMTVGQSRTVGSRSRITVAVGKPGLVTLRSDGQVDVRARLVAPDGRVVVANDDRPDDWNFRISEWLRPGLWTLEIEPVGGSGGETTVFAESPDEREGMTLQGRKPIELEVGQSTTVHTLAVGATRETVRVTAKASLPVGIGLEIRTPDGWQSLGTAVGTDPALLGRRTPGHDVRLRVWSLDGRRGKVEIDVDTPNPRSPSAQVLGEGLGRGDDWLAIDGKNVGAGLFRVRGDRSELRVCPRLGRACHPAGGVVALNEKMVLFGRRIQLERADLAGEPVPVELDERPTSIDTGLAGLTVVEIRAASGVAMAALERETATVVGEDGAIALGLGEARVWGEGVGRVRAIQLAQQRIPWDRERAWSGEIPARTAFVVPVDRDAARWTVSLERGLVVQVGSHALWADRDALRGNLDGAERILIANPTDQPAMALIQPPEPVVPAVVSGQPHERFAPRAGWEVLAVSGADGRLHAAGGSLAYLRSDGVLQRGSDVEIGPGGTAWMQHGTGWYAVWADAGGPGPWPIGDHERLDVQPGVTHLEADRPYAVLVDVDGQRRVEWRPEGGSVDVLAKQSGALRVRALGEGSVVPEVATERVTDIAEGLGPEVLLDAGGSRWFRFELGQDGPVGIGVRASADRVTATLVAPDGTEMASGVVRRVELTAGTWYLRLTQPADAAPVRARPALAGIDPPDDGPPEHVVRSYLEKAGLRPGGAR